MQDATGPIAPGRSAADHNADLPIAQADAQTLFHSLVCARGHSARRPIRQQLRGLGSAATSALVAGLSSDDPFTRWEAVNLLGDAAPADALQTVVEFALEERERHAQWRAAWAVGRFERQGVLARLMQALHASDPLRRWRAALILSMYGAQEAGPELQAGLQHADRWVRWEALGGVRALGWSPAVHDVIALFTHEESNALRRQAIGALGVMGGPAALLCLRHALHDDDAGVRRRACTQLVRWGAQSREWLLDRLSVEPCPSVRERLRVDLVNLERTQ